jgi:hypothetical protein
MKIGFIIHNSIDGSRQEKWIPGAPQKSWLRGLKVDASQMIPVATFKSQKCGFLESYAFEQ